MIAIQEANDVKDKLDDLIPWLEKLLATLTKGNPSKDPDEVQRRSQLAKFVSRLESIVYSKPIHHDRSLEDVGARAVSLSEKGKFARVVDKAKDSAEVVALVEKLRQASIIYQVSVRDRQSRKLLTIGADDTTTVNTRPGLPVDREF